MRIIYFYQGKESIKDFDTTEVVIGRPGESIAPDLDLTPDRRVSRPHARVWIENEQCWIEDLGSTRGTRVNDDLIKEKRILHPDDKILIGETTLTVEMPAAEIDQYDTQEDPYQTSLDPADPRPLEQITQAIDARIPAFVAADSVAADTDRRLNLFYDLPLQFAAVTRLDSLLQLIVERVVDVIAGAKRGALLVKAHKTDQPDKLTLKAHTPKGKPAASKHLARQAMERKKAFIWPPPPQQSHADSLAAVSATESINEYGIESAMYAPLMWKDEALGVVCVDNCESGGAFTTDDLRLLQAVAHHAAMAVANLQLQDELRRETQVLANLLKLVSPQIAGRLKQRRERLRPGGEFRDATILFSDIRGFTNLSATMNPQDVTDMLEDYFERLVPIVFKHQGTIDKFVGDAIMAVFGSPDSDEHQHIHAIQAALDMQAAMHEVNASRQAEGKHTGEIGIGIHCGEVVHGLIGTSERMEFTVIGDTVNRASRYCDGAPAGEVLISPELHQLVWDQVDVEPTSIPTKHEGTLKAYRVRHLK
jgi:adenylate cyclase